MKIPLATLAAVLLLAQPAAAGTVSVRYEEGSKGLDPGEVLTFTGTGGEANRLDVRVSGGELRLTDAVALGAGEGCEAVTAVEAVCRVTGNHTLEVRLGGGDDHAAVAGGRAVMDGGTGADTLVGGSGDDVLLGGPGADTVDGGGGDDIFGGAGAAAGEGPDRLRGGPGRDFANFSRARVPVRADLATGRVRLGAAKTVRLDGVEGVAGGPRADRLLGGPGDDRLYGDDGRDLVDGRGGDDRVTGGAGVDLVRGGSGDDRLELEDEGNSFIADASTGGNRVDCGAGEDELTTIYRDDVVSLDCETVVDLGLVADPRRAARTHLRLPGPACGEPRRCRERLTLRTGRGTLLARRDYRGGSRRARPVRLGRAARAILRRERARRVVLTFGHRGSSFAERFVIALPE